MSNEEKYLDLIEKYLNGSASVEEKELVTNLLNTDNEFMELYESERMIQSAVILSELTEIEKEVKAFVPRERSFFSKYWWVFGLVLLAVLSAYLLMPGYNIPLEQREKVITKPTDNKGEENKEMGSLNEIKKSILVRKETVIEPKEVEGTTEHLITVDSNKSVSELVLEVEQVLNEPRKQKSDTTVKKSKNINVKPCDTTKISFENYVEDACEEHDDGAIYIRNITGGTEPYEIISGGEYDLSFLTAGSYKVNVKDKNGCLSDSKTLKVKWKICGEPEEFVISLNQGGYFEPGTDGELTIVSEMGRVVYSSLVTNDFRWYGRNRTGSELPLGVYNFVLTSGSGTTTGVISVLD